MIDEVDIAIVGATGVVAEALFEILQARDFPVGQIFALASERSEGECVVFKNKRITVENVENFDFAQVQLAFFSVGDAVSKQYVPKATAAGCVVIDKSNAYRMDPDVPLVVPEVNPDAIAAYAKRNIIASPNCSTIQLVAVLKPVYDAAGIVRVNVCSYQAASGAGKKGIEELAQQTAELLNGRKAENEVFPCQLAFNVIPQIDVFHENGYTGEEMKIMNESKKIMGDENLRISATAVRVPVFHGHSEAVQIETKEKITAEELRKLLKKAPGIKVIDKLEKNEYPTPIKNGAGTDDVYVGRIREDLAYDKGISLWIVADNLRKGAALNSVQIAEILVRDYF